jgi:Flp pilus assembly protein TadG
MRHLSDHLWVKFGLRRAIKSAAALGPDRRGVVAIEFAIFAGFLCFAILNVIDVSIYIYQRMQVENATEMAAQAVWKTCDPSSGYLPATTSCPGLATALTSAVRSTSLGSRVSLRSGSPTEAYYCVNSSGSLQYVSSISNMPADCSATGMANLQPGDYIRIDTTFSYKSMFPGVTVAGSFATPITKTAWMRLN